MKYGVTAGAFDLGELQTRGVEPLELRLSVKGDAFKALDAAEEEKPVEVGEGELVYAQGKTVLTRHLAWRQAKEGLVGGKTRNVVFMSEVFHPEGEDVSVVTGLTRNVADEFLNGLKSFFGVEGRVFVLGEGVGVWEVGVENAFF